MLGYWGEWRRARELTKRFVPARDWPAPLVFAAWAAGTPFAAWASSLIRKCRRRQPEAE